MAKLNTKNGSAPKGEHDSRRRIYSSPKIERHLFDLAVRGGPSGGFDVTQGRKPN